LQSIVSRSVDPLESAVVSICEFHAGNARNVIPQTAELKGTVRTLTPEVRKLVEKRVREVVAGVAQMTGAKIDLQYEPGYPVVVNHAQQTDFAIQVAKEVAGDANVSADQILNALQPKAPLTRGLIIGQKPEAMVDPAVKAREIHFVDTLRNRKTRSLSLGEREEIAEIATSKPKIDLEIQFDYNSADISKSSTQAVQELGKALSNPSLRGSTFVVAGNTDGIGSDSFNQELSERRADTIKRYLVQNYGLTGSDLVTVGYGKTKLKDANDPADPINRRVEVVNMEAKTASK